MKKILVILGPTATGKSDLAVKLARKYNGEVVSADSRQVYKGLDIGTGKITKKEMLGIPHHMLDVVSPKKVFSVAEWKKQADEKIIEILKRGKLPIICGGTGFYIQSIVDNLVLPEVPPNISLRKKLVKVSPSQLFEMLKKLDSRRAENIAKEKGSKNPVRLIRAIEIATVLGSVPDLKKQKNPYEILQIGLKLPDSVLKEKIHNRILSRIKIGMVKEAENLHKNGLSWKRMRELGLEYRYLADILQYKTPRQDPTEKLETEIWHYAKHQTTWFKRDKNIKWFEPKEITKIDKLVSLFYS